MSNVPTTSEPSVMDMLRRKYKSLANWKKGKNNVLSLCSYRLQSVRLNAFVELS